MLAKTETGNAPWTIVEANDRRFAEVKVFQTVIRELADRVAAVKKSKKETKRSVAPGTKLAKISSSVLQKVDLSVSISREDYFEQLKKYQNRIRDLEHEVYVERLPVIILYEGWDAAGKGGNIKRLTQNMDPRGYEVIPISAPNDIEKKHHYMWRFWNQIPKAGHIAIFDRTWYGRVLVERVEQLCAESEWKRAYQEINEMEEQLTSFGSVVVKFWLHLDKDEQMRRFEERQSIPHKRWKITDEDWRNREKWDLYEEAVDEMLFRTSTPYAPWTIVESNSKHYARLKSLETVIKAIEMKLKK
jgi:polyphosphate kinase 2 (PPK2 family)